jgi:formylglycine-generating enzyme required for sulfatase activity
MKKNIVIRKIFGSTVVASFLITIFVSSCVDETPVTTVDTNQLNKPGTILNVAPAQGYVGDTITITGKDFGYYVQDSTLVRFDTIPSTKIIKWDPTTIQAVIPENVNFGIVKLTVLINDTSSNAIDFTITRPVYKPLEMIQIPAGTFRMGDLVGNGYENELPVHQVTISHPFLMSKYEITQPQWKAIVTYNPSLYKADSLPVNNLSWFDAVYFCNLLSDKEGFQRCYSGNDDSIKCDFNANGYRLPTEAEWEYACRAGTETDYYNGTTESDLNNIAWYYNNRDTAGSTRPVGLKQPNTFGLYDMQGNVSEWCWDWWNIQYDSTVVTDPTGPTSGPGHALRGGSWMSKANACRSSFRYYYWLPYFRINQAGLRVVRKM